MRITERLNVEHGVFLRQLDHLQRLVHSHAPRPVLAAVARMIADAVRAHRLLEDELLYPLLQKTLGGEFPQLAEMEGEHEEIDEGLEAIEAGTFDSRLLERFIEVLGAHMEKEIHVLFPLVDTWVPAETLSTLNNWYVDHIRERNGAHAQLPDNWLG